MPKLAPVRPTDRPFVAALTRCAGTWLASPPSAEEEQAIAHASAILRQQRALSVAFHSDAKVADAFSINLFRRPEFAPLTFESWLIAEAIAAVGHAPTQIEASPAGEAIFSNYLRRAALSIAHARNRKALAGQLRRFLPSFVAAERWNEAIAIDANAFRTALGNEVSPFLAQMTLAGLSAYYEEYEADDEDEQDHG